MESRWRDLVILDYEADFPRFSTLELALYSTGAAHFPTILLGESKNWGIHRRAGVLEIPAQQYDRVLSAFEDSCADATFVRAVSARFRSICEDLARLNRDIDDSTDLPEHGDLDHLLQDIIDALANLMSYHVLNWAIPLEGIESYLKDLGYSSEQARECLMRLLVPTTPAHLIDFFEQATSASRDISGGSWTPDRALEIAEAIGHLQAPGMAERPFEDSDTLERYLRSFSVEELANLDTMREARKRTDQELARQVTYLYLSTGGSESALAHAEAIVGICRLAAEEEEQRRRWQSLTLRNIRRLAERFALNLDDHLPTGCDAPKNTAATTRSIFDVSKVEASWSWIHAD